MFEFKIKTVVDADEKIANEVQVVHRRLAVVSLGEHVALVKADHANVPVIADDSLKITGWRHHVLSHWKKVGDANPPGK